MTNPMELINEVLEIIPNFRTKEVIVRRFGLRDGQKQTLEAIGIDHKITRERVRQIEENGLSVLRQDDVISKFQPYFDLIKNHLADHGEMKREGKLYDDLICVCYPAKEIEKMRNLKDFNQASLHAMFNFIMALGKDFQRLPENEHFHSAWTINKNSAKTAKKTVDSLVKHFNTEKKVLEKEELLRVAKKYFPELSENAIHSFVDVGKHIEQNHLGHFGLAHWPEINPRGVKDRAYIILKSEKRPLHFSEVTDLINKILPSKRKAYVQTVHNELIKDERFVLVGRGLYALMEWGYEPGTVLETIMQILKKENVLARDEIVSRVLQKRMVKENTVLINLQNRKLFVRDNAGRYSLKA